MEAKLSFLRLDCFNQNGVQEQFLGFFNDTLQGIEDCRAEIGKEFFYSSFEPELTEYYQITVFESKRYFNLKEFESTENLMTKHEKLNFIWNIWQSATIKERRTYIKLK